MPATEKGNVLRTLLLDLLAALPDEGVADRRIAQFAQSADAGQWQAFVESAAIHGVLGVVAPVLQRVALPPAVAEHLQRRAVIESMWHAQVRGAIVEAATLLSSAGVPACALKGPALAARLYVNPTARPSMDADLLVRPDDLPRAIACLTGAGYRADDDDATREYLLRHSHHLSFSRANQPGLEVHFHAYAGFGTVIPSSALMDRARPFELDGASVLVPAPEDELVYLAVHAAGHSFIRLLWLYDLKQLVAAGPAIDWHAVADRAAAWRVSGPTGAALDLLRLWLGVSIPDYALRANSRLRPRAARLLLGHVSTPSHQSVADNLGGLIYTALLCDRTTSGMRLVSHHVLRALKRRAHQAAPRALPQSWGG